LNTFSTSTAFKPEDLPETFLGRPANPYVALSDVACAMLDALRVVYQRLPSTITCTLRCVIVSTLLDDLINLAEDGKQPLPDILRKCLRLGHELKNERLKQWANQELGGYDDDQLLPDYRKVHARAKGNFAGPYYAQRLNYIIPSVAMEEQHRMYADSLPLGQSVSAYADLISKATAGVFVFPWPSNLIAYYQDKLMQGDYICHSAWQEIPTNVLVEVLETVRTRTLNMALQIKDELGTSYADLNKAKAKEAEIQNIVINNVGNVAFGNASVGASAQTIVVGDRNMLDAALTKAGLDQTDLNELSEAILVDGGTKPDKPGTKLDSWIQSKAGKIVIGGAKVGMSIGQQLLTDWLLIHAGLKKP
jgi:AbiTii